MTTPNYCIQNDGNCPTCSLTNYGRDCTNQPLKGRWFSLADLAKGIAGGNLATMAKLLNDTKAITLDELKPDPGAQVSRQAVIELAAMRAGDIVGRRAVKLLV